ncbi:hypothetical protein RHGRI_015075 [Rhododendron griersonianum]|uniref:Uncharacterized protein n=1 Tax=Rhododendron griersonianum TaxID=479676 RepID=A0AAV6KBV3_9ERIC|nr:hypothetical protein RHGRI_015075 [Rhododendron griersonianum]
MGTATLVEILLAIFLPPVGVFLRFGCGVSLSLSFPLSLSLSLSMFFRLAFFFRDFRASLRTS